MKQLLMFVLLTSGMVTTAWADSRTAKLLVSGMNCAMCPITVRKALENVDGVTQANVNYETRFAVVVYDDQKTNVGELTQATGDAGFPSTEIKQE